MNPVAAVLYVPRQLLGMVDDIRSIAQATREIRGLAEYLAAIEERVESMDSEVRMMREGVDRLYPEVTAMRESVEPLEGHLRGVGSLARLASRLPGGRAKGRRDEAELEVVEGTVEGEAEQQTG
jgi:hypothetical protein